MLSVLLTALSASTLLTNVFEIASKSCEQRVGTRFELTARVSHPSSSLFPVLGIDDDTGALQITAPAGLSNHPRAGDVIRACGTLHPSRFDDAPSVALCESVAILSHGAAPSPITATMDDISSGRFRDRLITVEGKFQDIVHDDIDPNWYYAILNCDGAILYATIPSAEDLVQRLIPLIDAKVSISGLCIEDSSSIRRLSGRLVGLTGPEAIRVQGTKPSDPFSLPDIDNLPKLGPNEIQQLGRRKACGTVIAIWQNRKALVRTCSGKLTQIEIANDNIPACGWKIEAVGFTETDLYRVNLSRAIWRRLGNETCAPASPQAVSASTILADSSGHPRVDPEYHGRAIAIHGIVKSLSGTTFAPSSFIVDNNGFDVPIDVSANPALLQGVAVGCKVEIAGICIINTDNWQPHSAFPSAKGFILVPRIPKDIRIISAPPWWTPNRMLAAICILIAALLTIMVWNRLLNRIVEQRGRQLLRDSISLEREKLRVEERTRLAVELHDTISQNLTGVALQIDAAEIAAKNKPESVYAYLTTCRNRMRKCREDLRNCLWDLRSRAFEEKRLSDAIRKTLEPHCEHTRIIIDCDLHCHDLSDNSIHAILCIIRELVINAVRHGHASQITISGKFNADGLCFVVRDDGCGFDPLHHAGPADGHFGLEGISERIHRLEGEMELDSQTGGGTTVIIRKLNPEI